MKRKRIIMERMLKVTPISGPGLFRTWSQGALEVQRGFKVACGTASNSFKLVPLLYRKISSSVCGTASNSFKLAPLCYRKIQVLEPTRQYPSTVDTMRRFGGSMLPAERAEGCHCAFGDAQKFRQGSRPGDRMGASGGHGIICAAVERRHK